MTKRLASLFIALSIGVFACNDSKLLGEGAPTGTPTDAPTGTPMASPTPTPIASAVGCADGTREGFVSQSTYPNIAACAGAWSLPGISGAGVVPACGFNSGNSSSNPDGTGCSAADLCASGWHICRSHHEVTSNAPGGCSDAAPGGNVSPGVFFAIAQHSHDNSVCNDTAGDDNDIFGCGNLGGGISSGQGCGPLTAALASEQPNTCGWNQAMPPIGPWQCSGSNSLNEGDFVTKNGCPNHNCSYSGNPIGNSDDGGVLCCRD